MSSGRIYGYRQHREFLFFAALRPQQLPFAIEVIVVTVSRDLVSRPAVVLRPAPFVQSSLLERS